jgi:hypothetical protein
MEEESQLLKQILAQTPLGNLEIPLHITVQQILKQKQNVKHSFLSKKKTLYSIVSVKMLK